MPTQIQLKPVEMVEIEPESAVPHVEISVLLTYVLLSIPGVSAGQVYRGDRVIGLMVCGSRSPAKDHGQVG